MSGRRLSAAAGLLVVSALVLVVYVLRREIGAGLVAFAVLRANWRRLQHHGSPVQVAAGPRRRGLLVELVAAGLGGFLFGRRDRQPTDRGRNPW